MPLMQDRQLLLRFGREAPACGPVQQDWRRAMPDNVHRLHPECRTQRCRVPVQPPADDARRQALILFSLCAVAGIGFLVLNVMRGDCFFTPFSLGAFFGGPLDG